MSAQTKRAYARDLSLEAPRGRDSIAQGASALGSNSTKIGRAPTGRDSLAPAKIWASPNLAPLGLSSLKRGPPGLAPWAIESRPDWGCLDENRNSRRVRPGEPIARVITVRPARRL